MTDPIENTTTEPQDATGAPTEAEDTTTAPEDATGKAAREAARYRRQLREVEAQRDELAAKVAEFEAEDARRQRAVMLDEIAGEFKVPADVLRGESEDELRAHAEALSNVLKPLLSSPLGPGKTPDLSKVPENHVSSGFSGAFGPQGL